MKMTIKLKVKHIVAIVVVILLFLPLSSLLIMPQIELAVAKNKISNGDAGGKGQLLEMLDSAILPSQKQQIIQDYMLVGGMAEKYDIYVGPSMTSSSNTSDSIHFNWEERLPYLQDYLENGPVDGFLKTVADELAEGALIEVDADRARRAYQIAINRLENTRYDHFVKEIDQQLEQMENQLKRSTDSQSGDLVTMTGKVTYDDGTPISNAGIFLREAQDVNNSSMHDEPYQVMTDSEGNYEISGIVPGKYQLFTGFMAEDVDGYTWPVDMNDWIVIDGTQDVSYDVTLAPLMEVKTPTNEKTITDDEIHFVWDEVAGAAYYMLHFHIEEEEAAYGYGLDMKINDTEVMLPIEDLYNLASNIILSKEETTEEYFNPATFLGFENPDGSYSWNVEAYDANGKLITRSVGYRLNEGTIGNLPIIYLKERELIEADKLLLDSKLEEALVNYQKNVKENPEDVHSLRMITRIIGIHGDGTFDTFNRLRLPYLKKLALATKDSSHAYEVATYYYEERNWEAYQEWYNYYLEFHNGEPSSYVKSTHANSLLFQGEYNKAAALHKEALKGDSDRRYIGNLLAAEILLGTELEQVMELSEKYPYHDYALPYGSNTNWHLLLNNIQKELEGNSEALNELKIGIKYYFNNDLDRLDNWKETVQTSSFSKFIHALEKANE